MTCVAQRGRDDLRACRGRGARHALVRGIVIVAVAMVVAACAVADPGATSGQPKADDGAAAVALTQHRYMDAFVGTWRVVWDRGQPWEERATVRVTSRSGRLVANGLFDISVSEDGVVSFRDDEGYVHVGQLDASLRRVAGTYVGAGWRGVWEASKQ